MGFELTIDFNQLLSIINYILTVTGTILKSCGVTLAIFLIVILTALPLGFVFTLITRSKIAPIRWIMNGFIYLLRGTPLMLQLLFVYFGLPYISERLIMGRFAAACVAFILNYACYLAEIYRGGLLAVEKGQYEAAKVLGLTKLQTTIKIIIPQMIRVSLPAIGNEAVTLLKDTALVFTIGLVEMTHITKTIVNRDSNPLVFVIAGLVYLIINSIITYAFKKVEKKLEY